ncbi:uncharacterized protein LOC109846555 [Asparagus officinalis]|uniref:uncharacterized protein LOC109846555 n=1 Tax=Asparagus officinalis TaxID=4686 RepID=UPI00098E7B8F|nr:uncharacterized protein LOC109846555 [Asparagus officinalis]
MDDNLLSSSSEDDNDDLVEVTRMAPGCKSKNIIQLTSMPERRILVASNQPPQCTRSELPHPKPSSIAQPDQLESPQTIGSSIVSVPSTRRNVRGATREKGTERLVRQLGHAILVPIPSSSGAPEGEHSTSLTNEIGKEIQSSTSVHSCGWDNIDAEIREAIILRVRQRFNVGDYENYLVIQDSIKKKCQSIYRNWKHELHAYYHGLIEKGVPDPKNHPPKRVEPNDWVSMIDVWETEEWKVYGIYLRRSSSTRSIAKSAELDAEVVALKETLAVQTEHIASQAKQMNAQAEHMNAQAQKTTDLEDLVHQLFARSQP